MHGVLCLVGRRGSACLRGKVVCSILRPSVVPGHNCVVLSLHAREAYLRAQALSSAGSSVMRRPGTPRTRPRARCSTRPARATMSAGAAHSWRWSARTRRTAPGARCGRWCLSRAHMHADTCPASRTSRTMTAFQPRSALPMSLTITVLVYRNMENACPATFAPMPWIECK